MPTIGRDSARLLAGLQIDLLRKFRNNQVTVDHLEWFLLLTKNERDQFTNVAKMEKQQIPNLMLAQVLSQNTRTTILCVSLHNNKGEPRFIHVEVGNEKGDDKITNFSWVRVLGSCDLKGLWSHHPEEKEAILLSVKLVRAIEKASGYNLAVATGYRSSLL